MTRINCGIEPVKLSRQHLLAEHREIKRIPNIVSKGKCNLKNLPKEFKLGIGHVRFFYDKQLYLLKRYEGLYKECRRRNYDVTYFGGAWKGVPKELMNDYRPRRKDISMVKERIKERTNESKGNTKRPNRNNTSR